LRIVSTVTGRHRTVMNAVMELAGLYHYLIKQQGPTPWHVILILYYTLLCNMGTMCAL